MMKSRRKKNSRKLRKLLRVLLVLLPALAAIVLLILALQVPKVTFADSLRFPVDTELTLSDIVKDVEHGALSEPDKALDSSKKGLIKFTFTVENLFKIKSEKEIMIEFYSPEQPKDDESSVTEKPNTTEKPVDKIAISKELPSSRSKSGSISGSFSHTSTTALLIIPDMFADFKAAVSTASPRDVLINTAPLFTCLKKSSPQR